MTPTKLIEENGCNKVKVRVGGTVKINSVQYYDNLNVKFTLMDDNTELTVKYKGKLPDLFKENQMAVAEGKFDHDSKMFEATSILAKHNEDYRPPKT